MNTDNELDASKRWHKKFSPSYTPHEMIELGIFEGIYTHAIEGLPKEWLESEKVLERGATPDENINYYRIKSRQSLKVWEEKHWTTEDSPLGWWQWYCLYFLGRRIPEEDNKQINRWYSFVARHQGQITKACELFDESCRPRQRQGLLQWAWDSKTAFTEKQRAENRKRIIKHLGIEA